jgi:hypothetical protein
VFAVPRGERANREHARTEYDLTYRRREPLEFSRFTVGNRLPRCERQPVGEILDLRA